MKSKTKLYLKIALGLLLVAYVLRSKMIDFHSLGQVLLTPMNLFVGIGALLFSAICVNARWFLLARAQGLAVSYWNMFELTMIGSFFNTFMPGSVGGDLVKAWYIAGEQPGKKTRAVFTVLVDRVIGLAVFFLYSAAVLVLYTRWLAGQPKLQTLAAAVWGFSAASILGGLLFFTPFFWRIVRPEQVLQAVKRWPFVERVLDAVIHYRHHLVTICVSTVLSATSILCTILLYKWIGDTLGIELDFAHYCFIVPLALTASAIPLLPGGIGVGQVAFFTLFLWTGAVQPDRGGSLCTAMQVYTIIFNSLGAIFYLKFKRKPQPAEPLAEPFPVR